MSILEKMLTGTTRQTCLLVFPSSFYDIFRLKGEQISIVTCNIGQELSFQKLYHLFFFMINCFITTFVTKTKILANSCYSIIKPAWVGMNERHPTQQGSKYAPGSMNIILTFLHFDIPCKSFNTWLQNQILWNGWAAGVPGCWDQNTPQVSWISLTIMKWNSFSYVPKLMVHMKIWNIMIYF